MFLSLMEREICPSAYLLLFWVVPLALTGQQLRPLNGEAHLRLHCCPALEEMSCYQGVQVGKEF